MYMWALRGYEQAWGTSPSACSFLHVRIFARSTPHLTEQPVALVAAGGVNDGRSLATALMLGAGAVWISTRFVTAKESGASEFAKRSSSSLASTWRSKALSGVAVRCWRYRTLTSKMREEPTG